MRLVDKFLCEYEHLKQQWVGDGLLIGDELFSVGEIECVALKILLNRAADYDALTMKNILCISSIYIHLNQLFNLNYK